MKNGKILKTLTIFGTALAAPIFLTGCFSGNEPPLTKYNITYELNGGVNNLSNPNQFTEETSTITLNEPTRQGYTFLGWYSDEDFETKITYIKIGTKTDITLYAKWSINQYTITFNPNGGSSVDSITEDYGTVLTAPESPTKDGYIFVGWYKDYSLTQSFKFNSMPAQNMTLYAKYEALFNVSTGTITGLTTYAKNITGLELVIPERINGYKITSISDNAFLSNSNIVSVTIGNNVTSIGDNAFARCSKLTSVIVPNSVTTMGDNVFFQCSQLKIATIGTGLKVLPNATFGECSKLTSLTLSEGLTKIGELAIARCTSLTEITIPNSVTELQYGALAQNSGLTTVNMGTGVRTLGESVFLSNSKLTTINLPEGITTISKGLFGGCSCLTNITLPSTVNTIGDSVFAECTKLESIIIPKSVASIGKTVFQYCENLKTVTFANDGVLSTVGDYLFQECDNLETVVFPANLQTLSLGLFYKCGKLQNVTLPTALKTINEDAFYSCSSLKLIDLPDGLRTIKANAFSSCTALQSIYLPSTLTTITTSRTLFNSTIDTYSCSPFYKCSRLTIYCGASSKPSGFSQYWNIKEHVSNVGDITVLVEFNTTREEFDEISHPYREVVAEINENLNNAKTIFNNVVNETLNANIAMVYEDNTRFEFSKTKNFIFWTTENTKYLQFYKNGTNLMYSAHYSASDEANGYGYIQAMDTSVTEDEEFDNCVKNHLHAIYDITKIEAIEDFDYYTMKVTMQISPSFSIEIEYRVKDGKINQIYDGEETILIYNSSANYTLTSNPFSVLKKLYIDDTFIEDTTLLDFTMVEGVETIYISRGLDIPAYITENFDFVEDDFMYKIYQIKTN